MFIPELQPVKRYEGTPRRECRQDIIPNRVCETVDNVLVLEYHIEEHLEVEEDPCVMSYPKRGAGPGWFNQWSRLEVAANDRRESMGEKCRF